MPEKEEPQLPPRMAWSLMDLAKIDKDHAITLIAVLLAAAQFVAAIRG